MILDMLTTVVIGLLLMTFGYIWQDRWPRKFINQACGISLIVLGLGLVLSSLMVLIPNLF